MEFRHVLGVVLVIGLLTATFTALIDQSDRLVGVHEILPFSQSLAWVSPLGASMK
jgi:hypothetical protein